LLTGLSIVFGIGGREGGLSFFTDPVEKANEDEREQELRNYLIKAEAV
jgi:hypothetical protein